MSGLRHARKLLQEEFEVVGPPVNVNISYCIAKAGLVDLHAKVIYQSSGRVLYLKEKRHTASGTAPFLNGRLRKSRCSTLWN